MHIFIKMKTIEIKEGINLMEISEGDIVIISSVEKLVLNVSKGLIITINKDKKEGRIIEERYWKDNGKLDLFNIYSYKQPKWNELNRRYEELNQRLNEVLL